MVNNLFFSLEVSKLCMHDWISYISSISWHVILKPCSDFTLRCPLQCDFIWFTIQLSLLRWVNYACMIELTISHPFPDKLSSNLAQSLHSDLLSNVLLSILWTVCYVVNNPAFFIEMSKLCIYHWIGHISSILSKFSQIPCLNVLSNELLFVLWTVCWMVDNPTFFFF